MGPHNHSHTHTTLLTPPPVAGLWRGLSAVRPWKLKLAASLKWANKQRNTVPSFFCRSRSVRALIIWSSWKVKIVPRCRRNTQRFRWLGALSGWMAVSLSLVARRLARLSDFKSAFHSPRCPTTAHKRQRMCESFNTHLCTDEANGWAVSIKGSDVRRNSV